MKIHHQIFRKPGVSGALFLCLSASIIPVKAVDIEGDTVTGDLTVQGDRISLTSGSETKSYELRYDDVNNTTASWQSQLGEWTWSYGSVPTDVMSLDSNHILSLYDRGVQSVSPAILIDPGNPDADPAILPSMLLGGSEVVTAANGAELLGTSFVIRNSDNLGSADSFLMEGILDGPGTIPKEGAGVRIMWYPEKAAFRAGSVSSSQWDEANLGSGSFAGGIDSVASGIAAFAFGVESDASGDQSVAFGKSSYSGNFASFVIGAFNENRTDAQESTAKTTWQGDDQHSVLEVGIGTGASDRKNALTVLQDGSVEIGKATATDNSVPLHIKADGTILLSKPQGDISMGIYQ